ncbi:hypothetical protein FHR83_006355 [Actinoplanes campanulatus]|uniref:Uncharacterized protein n=1 Tax=Actinoplanes campanulatus TaxID=113559 RepID=A0A7W5ALV9_9ACTN|nr:hypothetical protein [Actinoplanes campanulatus]MBB3098656.1 hypothetical protein [Actinoplanes campanulatus]GGN36350.1 hypothetical protein GCM10010109_61230 [Actinoplanes campanulatus]GID39346.1 hypothetical protein Aca09nite_58520 [Actinoplanes campanulatus]
MAAPNAFDAQINSLYPVRKNTDFSISVLDPAKPFDVLADVEIGEGLNEFVDEHLLQVSVVDRSTATRVAFAEFKEPLKPEDNTPRTVRLRVPFGALTSVSSGDVMELVATYTVTAGVNTSVSNEISDTFTIQ